MVQRSQTHEKIKESEVEEALVANLLELKNLLSLKTAPKLIARQLRLKADSRLDLLLASGNQLILLELKVTKFNSAFIEQVIRYKKEIEHLQNKNELPLGNLILYLLVTDYSTDQLEQCKLNNILLVKYSPENILNNYYQQLLKSTYFLRVKPRDYGVFSLGVINRTLLELSNGETTEKHIATNTNLSVHTTHLHLQTASEFGLVRKRNNNFFLTDLGDEYISVCDEGKLRDQISDKQAELLRQYVAKFPFASSMVFGIYAIVETTFLLARNSYPIDFNALVENFMVVSGKVLEWKRTRAKNTATYSFLNFAIDLGLLGKVGSKIVITPSGFRFILMLQLHKSIEMIDSLQK